MNEFDDRLIRMMNSRQGCTVGQALDQVRTDDPNAYFEWEKSFKLTQDGWLRWAKGLVLKAILMQDPATATEPGYVIRKKTPDIIGTTATMKGNSMIEPRSFESAVTFFMQKGMTRLEAVKEAVKQYPKLHDDYIKRCQQGSRCVIPSGK